MIVVRHANEDDRLGLRQHPLSAAFPAMPDEDYIVLRDSIESMGVQNPVTLYEGMVLDGWHRYRAATELGMHCSMQELGDVDPRDFVLAQNKARRHVTAAQMAMATTAVYAWWPFGANQHGGSALSADPLKSTRELATIAGVGTRSIEQAKAVIGAAPEVQAAVQSGAIGLPKASAIAKLPQNEQAAALNRPLPRKAPASTPPPSPAQAEAARIAQDAYGDTDIVAEWQTSLQELDVARRTIEALSASDLGAEVAKWIRIAEVAQRRQGEIQDRLVERERELGRLTKMLRRIGRAVGEDDPTRVAAAVEAHLASQGVEA